MDVVGIDGTRGGWVAVCLAGGEFAEARVHSEFTVLIQAFPRAAVITVDIPIGLPLSGRRSADQEARRVLGARINSVFFVPPRSVLEAPTFAEAVRIARSLDSSVSQQSYALGPRILEVARLTSDRRIVEVHPEVSFWAMNNHRSLAHGKRTWNGLMMRWELLQKSGVELPNTIANTDDASADDIIDAAAAAWSALRIARGEGRSLPDPPEADLMGRQVAIWY